MENPATWDHATIVVAEALHKSNPVTSSHIVGLSQPRQITDALRAEGYRLDEPDKAGHRTTIQDVYEGLLEVISDVAHEPQTLKALETLEALLEARRTLFHLARESK